MSDSTAKDVEILMVRHDRARQQARNMVMDLEDTGVRARFLLHDRDASFGAAFDAVFTAAGIEVIRTGVRAPRHNSIMERWFRTLRAELPTAPWSGTCPA